MIPGRGSLKSCPPGCEKGSSDTLDRFVIWIHELNDATKRSQRWESAGRRRKGINFGSCVQNNFQATCVRSASLMSRCFCQYSWSKKESFYSVQLLERKDRSLSSGFNACWISPKSFFFFFRKLFHISSDRTLLFIVDLTRYLNSSLLIHILVIFNLSVFQTLLHWISLNMYHV